MLVWSEHILSVVVCKVVGSEDYYDHYYKNKTSRYTFTRIITQYSTVEAENTGTVLNYSAVDKADECLSRLITQAVSPAAY